MLYNYEYQYQGWGKLILVGQARARGQSQTVFVELNPIVNYMKSKPAVDVSVMSVNYILTKILVPD